jgi:hypothetical protein
MENAIIIPWIRHCHPVVGSLMPNFKEFLLTLWYRTDGRKSSAWLATSEPCLLGIHLPHTTLPCAIGHRTAHKFSLLS